jgi:hypothetical protein
MDMAATLFQETTHAKHWIFTPNGNLHVYMLGYFVNFIIFSELAEIRQRCRHTALHSLANTEEPKPRSFACKSGSTSFTSPLPALEEGICGT